VQESGRSLRLACADARAAFLAAASERLDVPEAQLTVADGVIAGPANARTSYGELAGAVDLDRPVRTDARPKSPAARRVSGVSAARIDLPDKVFGRPRFIHDLVLPGMLHGRVVRCRRPGATIVAVDECAATAVPDVLAVVRNGSFLGVLARTEVAAVEGARRLETRLRWSEGSGLPDEAAIEAWHRGAPRETREVFAKEGEPPPAGQRLSASYGRPFLAHGSIAPSCALAQWTGERLAVWSHSQGIPNLKADLALVLGLPADAIVVAHVEGAGCYGHNGADDVALDAVLLAREAGGAPVRVQWSRADELALAPAGAAMTIDVAADLDPDGRIALWRQDVIGNGHVNRPGRAKTPALLAGYEIAPPFPRLVASNPPLGSGGGAERNAVPPYDIPSVRVTSHRVTDMPLRTSSLRALGAHGNVFAAEGFMDELAEAAGADPLDFRLAHLTDPRARAVLETVAARGAWRAPVGAGVGKGLAFARYKGTGAYCAVLAEVEGDAEIRVTRLVVAVDVGEAINPDGVVNQIEGGAVQATSWTLKEAVRFDRAAVTSIDWESYPILRFLEVPAVEIVLIDRPELPPLGAGEAAHGPTAAAIGNAVYRALGVRVRRMPITREAIIAAMGEM
jgi:nicotinate dehydrogenase subunit B